jgi:hypothetical protein
VLCVRCYVLWGCGDAPFRHCEEAPTCLAEALAKAEGADEAIYNNQSRIAQSAERIAGGMALGACEL